MSFFNGNQEEERQDDQNAQEQQEAQAALEKIKLGDEEYSQSELQELVKMGKLGKEVEQKYNTRLDRVYPAFTRTSQENKELKGQLEQLQQQAVEQAQSGDISQQEAQEQIQRAREAARKLGIVTSDDFEDQLSQSFRKMYAQERETEQLLEELDRLEGEIDGKDGVRPAFDKLDILEFMKETGHRNPLKAYKDKYEDAWNRWQVQQMSGSNKGGFYTQGSTQAEKQPPRINVNKDNLKDLISEVFNS